MTSMVSLFSLLLSLSLSCLLANGSNIPNQIPKHYVVYMGSSSEENAQAAQLAYMQLLSSIIPSEEKERISVLHHYSHALKGFSAMLTPSEASILSGHDGIVSVFEDPTLKLHTTRSWDFLDTVSGIRYSHPHNPHYNISSDIIVGVIDTGIWPESPSFDDNGIGEIPSRWNGVCMEAPDFKKSNCNRKLIGARYYSIVPPKSNGSSLAKTSGSPRDAVGHGTHTASTAAGSRVANASYYGLAQGTARGGSPSTRIASYKACSGEGCSGAIILKAIDDAVKDGVDIISISIGLSSIFQADYISDPIAIGAFHAERMRVMVVCSAGNDGPDPYTVVNSAPWILTVAASSIDRNFQSDVILGNGRTFHGSGINFSNLTHSKTYPLVFGKDAASSFTPESEARNCYPGSLDPRKVAGKIVVCVDEYVSVSRRIKKLVAEDAKARGLILINENQKDVPLDTGIFPFVEIGNAAGFQILNYINSTKKPTATILPAVEVPKYKPAPKVASFSSRGPSLLTENILKPDIMAPGVAILAAVIPKNEPGSFPVGVKPSGYVIRSGTSMACPHVTGAAAFIKSVHRQWTSSIIKSALMTTAIQYNNLRKFMTNSTNYPANPHEMGVGEISPLKALDPGLVFETTITDHLRFLCYYGYPKKIIKSLSSRNFNCPKISKDELISNLNYPSISISKLDRHQPAKILERTVTNVGNPNSTYVAKVHSPMGLAVKVFPSKLVFSQGVTKISFKVSFYGKVANSGYNFGSITWVDGTHSVRTVFAVNVE